MVHLDGVEGKRPEAIRQLIDRVFYPSPIVRGDGVWVHSDDLSTPASRDGLVHLLRALPAVQFVGEKGKVAVSTKSLGELQGSFDLTARGYTPIIPLRGTDLAWRTRPGDGPICAVVPADPPFGYREEKERNIEEAEKVLRDNFPGVRLDVLRLLIAAKGVIQRGDGTEPPKVFLLGQSEAAKTAHVLLAAELCCDRVERGEFSANRERLLQNYAALSQSASFVLFDELDKAEVSDRALLAGVLSLVAGKSYHQLYHGTRQITQPAVVVMADTRLPDALARDVQAARRIVLCDIGAGLNAEQRDGKRVDWRVTCGGAIEGWRKGDQKNPNTWRKARQDVADTIVSDVIDRWFAYTGVTFTEIAHDLGFKLLSEQSVEGIDLHAARRELFFVASRAEDYRDGEFKGRGWKVFDPQNESALAKAFRATLDNSHAPGDPKGWQELTGAQWGSILGCPGVELDIHRNGRRVGLRFRLGNARSKDVKFNGEIPVAHRSEEVLGETPAEVLPFPAPTPNVPAAPDMVSAP
jgi:hypothetical protein